MDPYATVDDVFSHLPPSILRPHQVATDGKGGVTSATYARWEKRYRAYCDAELRKHGVAVPAGVHPTDTPDLLAEAFSNMLAGAILRRFNNADELYKELFASGNIFLRAYVGEVLAADPLTVAAPAFVDATEAADLSAFPQIS